ncbi:MAG: DUF503 domain-containing protein [Syntrophomonadaceae bacterium]|jgi:uncharacterized protein YlxP (DUF503 family)|nr:DUF503 domain-containing protein [Syntrophomonadaceae bacterium]
MYVVYGYVELYLPYCSSLKEKRKIIHGLISRVRKRFNVSTSEVEFHDLWQRSGVGFSAVSHYSPGLELITNSIKETFLNYSPDAEMTLFNYDIISCPYSHYM